MSKIKKLCSLVQLTKELIHENYRILKSFSDECRKPKREEIIKNKDITINQNSEILKFSDMIKEKRSENHAKNKMTIYEIK